MSIAAEGLSKWRSDKRRNAVNWYRKHGVAAMLSVGAQRGARGAWEGAYRAGGSTVGALRASMDALRGVHVTPTEEVPDTGQARSTAMATGRSSATGTGQALAMAAVVISDEAEAIRGATETALVVDGLRAGFETISTSVSALAESAAVRKMDRKLVREVDSAAEAVADLAAELERIHRNLCTMYGSQMDQEDATGETMS